ncbi:MAG: hypothetical protein M3198_02520 [Actinomycetota bacterium]|nr:hypothetical protein [Actinomycetota bacterium]
MEQKNDDLASDDGLPTPGTQEPESGGSEGSAESGPGNVSVDEPTAGALDSDAGSPGGQDEASSGSDEDTSEDTSDDEDQKSE